MFQQTNEWLLFKTAMLHYRHTYFLPKQSTGIEKAQNMIAMNKYVHILKVKQISLLKQKHNQSMYRISPSKPSTPNPHKIQNVVF